MKSRGGGREGGGAEFKYIQGRARVAEVVSLHDYIIQLSRGLYLYTSISKKYLLGRNKHGTSLDKK